MLSEARANCEARGLRNVELVQGDDDLSRLHGKFDLIHSTIVFQHIPVERGMKILARLLDHLDEGGCAMIHLCHGTHVRWKRLMTFVRFRVPFAKGAINVARGRAFDAPAMQMNEYDLSAVFTMLQSRGVRSTYCEHTLGDGELGVSLYFRRE